MTHIINPTYSNEFRGNRKSFSLLFIFIFSLFYLHLFIILSSSSLHFIFIFSPFYIHLLFFHHSFSIFSSFIFYFFIIHSLFFHHSFSIFSSFILYFFFFLKLNYLFRKNNSIHSGEPRSPLNPSLYPIIQKFRNHQ